MAKTEPFKKFKPKDWPVKFYGCEKYKLYSNKYFECLTRSYTATIVSQLSQLSTQLIDGFTQYHPAGTCSMGTCVDEELRVFGVPGLRVIDASIMPYIVSGNTNAPVIMIGEKGADIMLGKPWWRNMGHKLKPGQVPVPPHVQKIINKSQSKDQSVLDNMIDKIKLSG